MDAELLKRLEYLEQRINLLQASTDTVAIMISQVIVAQMFPHLPPEELGPLAKAHADSYALMRDQRSSKLSEFPYLPPDPPAF